MDLNKIVEAKSHLVRSSFAYELLGKFGARLPEYMLKELQVIAESEVRLHDVKMKRIKEKL